MIAYEYVQTEQL